MHKVYILFVISALLIVSCDEEIAFKGSETDPRLVVNCLISPDSVIIAHITQSNFIQKPTSGSNVVTNAEVRLYENSQFVGYLQLNSEEFEIGNTTYKVAEIYGLAGLNLTAGNLYRLTVEAPGFDPVAAQVVIPKPVEITRVDSSLVTIRQDWGEDFKTINFAISFNDPSIENNYYRLVVRETIGSANGGGSGGEKGTFYRIRVEKNISLLGANDLALNPSGDRNDDSFFSTGANKYMFFNDQLFNGKEATVSFYLKRYRPAYLYYKEFNFFNIELYSISKEYYLYEQSLRQFAQKHDDPFAEPVLVFSNVENGYGVFAAYNVNSYEIIEGVYPDESEEYSVEYLYY